MQSAAPKARRVLNMKVRMEEVLVIIIIDFKSALFLSIDAEMLSTTLEFHFTGNSINSVLHYSIKGVVSLLYVRYIIYQLPSLPCKVIFDTISKKATLIKRKEPFIVIYQQLI